MRGLVIDELIKLFKRKSSWIGMMICPILSIAMVIFTKLIFKAKDMPTGPQMWLNSGFDQIWMLLCIIQVAMIVANEYNGTWKMLLIRPHTRTAVIGAKAIVASIYAAVMIVVNHLFTLILCLLVLGGADELSEKQVTYLGATNLEVGMIQMLDAFVKTLFFIALTLIIVVLTHSQGPSIGVSIGMWTVAVMGSSILLMGSTVKKLHLTFTPFYALNLSTFRMKFEKGVDIHAYLTHTQGIIILLVYTVILYVIANVVFCKKDIVLE